MSDAVDDIDAEISQLERDLRAWREAQREAAQARQATAERLRADLATAARTVRALEEAVSQLDAAVRREQRVRDEATNTAEAAEAHLEELRRVGASRRTPVKHWRR